jgi:hypothetical protein
MIGTWLPHYMLIHFCGVIAQFRPRLLLSRFLDHHRHTPGSTLWTTDQPVAEAATYTTHNKYNRETSMLPAVFETTIPANELPQTFALDRRASGIGLSIHT